MEPKSKGMEFLEVMQKIKRSTIRPQGSQLFSHGEFMLMKAIKFCLQNNDNITQNIEGAKITDIAAKTGMSKPAMSRMINTLEKKGFIERFVHQEDRRVVCVQFTKKGRDTLDAMIGQFEDFICKVFDEMGDEDADTMIRLFKKLHSIILEHFPANQ